MAGKSEGELHNSSGRGLGCKVLPYGAFGQYGHSARNTPFVDSIQDSPDLAGPRRQPVFVGTRTIREASLAACYECVRPQLLRGFRTHQKVSSTSEVGPNRAAGRLLMIPATRESLSIAPNWYCVPCPITEHAVRNHRPKTRHEERVTWMKCTRTEFSVRVLRV